MHHSRVVVKVIDCQAEHLAASTAFWSRATGQAVSVAGTGMDGRYVELQASPGKPPLLLRSEHPCDTSTFIETDDLEAEVTRLEQLGAHRTAFLRGRWWGMQAPSGELFTVVKNRKLAGQPLNCWD